MHHPLHPRNADWFVRAVATDCRGHPGHHSRSVGRRLARRDGHGHERRHESIAHHRHRQGGPLLHRRAAAGCLQHLGGAGRIRSAEAERPAAPARSARRAAVHSSPGSGGGDHRQRDRAGGGHHTDFCLHCGGPGADRQPSHEWTQFPQLQRHHSGSDHRPHPAAGSLGHFRIDLRRPARTLEQHHGGWCRQQRSGGRRRACHLQPGGHSGIPGADEFLFGRVRKSFRRCRQYHHAFGDQRTERKRLRVLPQQESECQVALREVRRLRQLHQPEQGPLPAKSVRRHAGRADSARSDLLFRFGGIAAHRREQLRHHQSRRRSCTQRQWFSRRPGQCSVLRPIKGFPGESGPSMAGGPQLRRARQLRQPPEREHRAVRRDRGAEPRCASGPEGLGVGDERNGLAERSLDQ